jgi:serine/threonine protein kinase
MRATLDTRQDVVLTLQEYRLLSPDGLARARELYDQPAYRRPRDFAAALVAEGLLTRFQADHLLRGDGARLRLARYTLIDELGSGSMGTVYKAHVREDDSWYAVKVVPRRNVLNLNTITAKVRALEQVRHPRVSALVHVGAEGDRVFMVWPLIEGGEALGELIARRGPLSARQAAQVGLQIASGLQAYHDAGLFHGLLKPGDVLIGADRRVRLLDFGVGFLLTSERGKSLLDTTTNSRALAKGLDCASPESILDPLARAPAGDQYSLGCVLYFCLTGQFPFPDGNPVKKMLGHQFEQPPPPSELVPGVPRQLEAVVARLMAKAPEDRYGWIGEAVQDLQAIASDARLGALPPSWQAAIRRSAQGAEKRPAGEPAPPAPAEKVAPPAPAPDRPTPWAALTGVTVGLVAGLIFWMVIRG